MHVRMYRFAPVFSPSVDCGTCSSAKPALERVQPVTSMMFTTWEGKITCDPKDLRASSFTGDTKEYLRHIGYHR